MTDEELAKDLGFVSALTIGIGTMIGAGIFILPGIAARAAGPVVVASFVVGGVIAMVNALAVSELGTAMPKAGGGYYFVNRGLGPLFGSIAGLGDWIGLAFASAFYSIGFGQYLTTLVSLPEVLFLTEIQIGALIAGTAFVLVNYIGAKETGGVQTVIVTLLLAILTLFAIGGFLSFDWGTLTGNGGLAPMGYGAILPGTGLIFVAFLGYAKIATVAEELKNPGKNLPRAIIGSVAIVTVLYAILVSIMLGLVPWPELSEDAPLTEATGVAFSGEFAGIAIAVVTVGALLATASSANASILASARINFAMGRDKLVTNWLNEIHPQFATPYRSILVTGGMIVVFIGLLGQDVEILAKAASVLHLLVYAMMNGALLVFREADVPDYDPDFRVPLYPITPVVGIVASLGLMPFIGATEVALAAVFVAAAIVWYFVYARSRTEKEGVLSQLIMERSDRMPDPAVAAAETVSPDGGEYRVMVPLANPAHQTNLVRLGGAIAKQRGGSLDIVHVVTVPDQTSLQQGADSIEDFDAESEQLLERAREDAADFGVPVETHTIISHESFEAVFDAARQHEADLTVMGWGPHGAPGRAETTMDEITAGLPSDFLVFRDRGFDASRILVPTAGGPDSALSGEIAAALRAAFDADVELLHVADDRDAGETFLAEWADKHDLSDATLTVESGDPGRVIAAAADDATMLVLGATERGVISRLVSGTVVTEVADEVDCSVLLAERAQRRSIIQRLFGRR